MACGKAQNSSQDHLSKRYNNDVRTLIIGCGYTGKALGEELISLGHEVVGIQRDEKNNKLGQAKELLRKDIEKIIDSIPRNKDDYKNKLKSNRESDYFSGGCAIGPHRSNLAGYEKINISVDESAYLLGFSKRKTFTNIHIPFLRNSLLFIIILISLEIIRELPITLILRPFNFETFATTAYISASEDLLEAAAVPSLFLILIASIFIIIASKYILREKND